MQRDISTIEIDESILSGKTHVHFIGVGGSGMFPLVQILLTEGFRISGSDNNETETLTIERGLGVEVFMGHNPENLKGADLVVYSAAIMQDNPELMAAREQGILTIERSILLGLITKRYGNALCVSGTHGKTTTTSMLTQILFEAGLDPSAVIGGKLHAIGGSGRAGKSELMVCEACEFVDTFLKLFPDTAIILNIDNDHLDYFGTVENTIKSFHQFAEKATKLVIVNGDDANSMKAVEGLEKEIVTFGLKEHNDYRAENIIHSDGRERYNTSFDLVYKGQLLAHIVLHVPGVHNVYNAMAAMVAAISAGASPLQAAEGLSHFKGAGRRFEILGHVNGVTIADDYAHHPAELTVTLRAAKSMGYKKVWAVFQPFTFSRTYLLLEDFAQALSIADRVVLSPIMGSREVNTYNIYSTDLAEKIGGCVVQDSFEQIADYVLKNAEKGDLVITLGCGDIYKAAKLMLTQAE